MEEKKELTVKEIGKMGGKKTLEKYGREHMAKIAKKGNAGAFARDKEAARRAQALSVQAKLRKKKEREEQQKQAQNT